MRSITCNLSKEKFYQRFLQMVVCDSSAEQFKRNYQGVFMGKITDDNLYMFYKAAKMRKIYTTVLKGKIYGNNQKCMIEYKFSRSLLIRQPFTLIVLLLWICGGITAVMFNPLLGILPFAASAAFIVPIFMKAAARRNMLERELKRIAGV